jgi:carboxymethylenebutenolidase
MLITKDFHDVPTKLGKNERPIRIFVIAPKVPDYPHAKFPGMPTHTPSSDRQINRPGSTINSQASLSSGSVLPQIQVSIDFDGEGHSEIYQVTGPVERFAGQIASHGYVVGELCSLFGL